MARRRSRNRRWQLLVLCGAAVLAVGGVAMLRGGAEDPSGGSHQIALTGVRDTTEGEPALIPPRVTPPAESPPIEQVPSADEQPPSGAAPASTDSGARLALTPEPPATQPAVMPASRPSVTLTPEQSMSELRAGLEARDKGQLIEARDRLNRALHAGLVPEEARQAREALRDIAEKTVFAEVVALPEDPLTEYYTVRPGNSLVRIARRYKISEDLLAKINRLTNKNFIREGVRLKVIKGPFHASISKSDHLMHLYLGDVYVRTYRVSLGLGGSTPTGTWKVINHQVNPGWTDPRSGKRWHPDDPANPIGEYWIGLEGVEGEAVGQFGYGIHGTNEPETIGQDVSLGCVRLGHEDIAAVYRMLFPGDSIVVISD